MSDYSIDPQTIVDFWRDLGPERWFARDDELDATIAQRFGDVYERAAAGELDSWADEPNGALALVLILDQFPRNMFRGTPRAFETDAKALQLAKAALARGDHYHVGEDVNQFFALPLMHSENLEDQEACVRWMGKSGKRTCPMPRSIGTSLRALDVSRIVIPFWVVRRHRKNRRFWKAAASPIRFCLARYLLRFVANGI